MRNNFSTEITLHFAEGHRCSNKKSKRFRSWREGWTGVSGHTFCKYWGRQLGRSLTESIVHISVEAIELFISLYIQILILHTMLTNIKSESFIRRICGAFWISMPTFGLWWHVSVRNDTPLSSTRWRLSKRCIKPSPYSVLWFPESLERTFWPA